MGKIIILGAGLTGISTAYHLEKKGFFNYVLYEKESEIGGLCRSVFDSGFTFDYTGHLLHVNDSYVHSLIATILGFDQLESITRKSYIFSHNTYTKYPYQIHLHGLPTQTIIDCISGYVQQKKKLTTHASFYQWVMHHFGPGFAQHFFLPFEQKKHAYDPRKLSSSWTGRFVPQTSLPQILSGALNPNYEVETGYNAQFFYPKQGGIQVWPTRLASQLLNPIRINYEVQSVDAKKQRIYFSNGHADDYDYLINTIPLDVLLKKMDESADTTLYRAVNKLVSNSVVNFNIGVHHDISDKHWIYFPEKHIPFYRLGFPHNFSQGCVPPGCSSVYGEFSYINKSASWIKQQLHDSLNLTKKLLHIQETDIKAQRIMNISHAYVIYNQWRDRYLPSIHHRLQDYSIFSIGRYGQWKYSSMQEAILDGKKIVDTLLLQPAQRDIQEQIPVVPSPQPKKRITL